MYYVSDSEPVIHHVEVHLQEQGGSVPCYYILGYVGRQWVDGASFTPADWSVFRQEVRTNNDLEGKTLIVVLIIIQ